MKSVMQHQFSKVPQVEIPRSVFNRTHGHKTTFNGGYLIPVFLDEALPGDTFNLNMSCFARLATPLKPVMDNMYLESFFFAVPYRLVWVNWEKFNGAKDNPADSTTYICPTMDAPGGGGVAIGSLSDYFGIPTGINGITFNSFFHRAYNLIWNTWFRDGNLQNSVVVDTDNGPDTYTDYVLLRRGKRHDYFTSALPWPQRGNSVNVPLGTSAVVKTSASTLVTGSQNAAMWLQNNGVNLTAFVDKALTMDSAIHIGPSNTDAPGAGLPIYPTNLYADLSTALAPTINSLREAFQLQRMFERDARGGANRYTEILKSHFGVTSPDGRLQRPEYLGGGSTPINFNVVPQSTPLPAGGTLTPQGNLSAFATANVTGHGFTKSFTEHCLIIGLVCVRADLTYQQGLPRMFSRSTRYDYYWPSLAHLGEQSIKNKEIYCQGNANDELIFGYQERYAEYRYKPSQITGKFRSSDAGSLDVWHLSQEFGALPTLGSTFIQETPPIDRIIATANEPHFLFDSYFSYKCARPMPVYGVPGMIDHF